MAMLKKGLVQVYTGCGKGKTTAGFGLAWRMLGAGGSVYICQFLKPADVQTGESVLAEQFSGRLRLDRLENKWNMANSFNDPEQLASMRKAIAEKLSEIKQLAGEGKYDLVILDEIVFCLSNNLAKLRDVQAVAQQRAEHVELLLTGRGADQRLLELADLVTEMSPIKHPYSKGITARRGIEY